MRKDLFYLLFLSIECAVATACVIFNLVVLIAIARTPALRSANNLFIANLALADIGVGCVAIPMSVMTLNALPFDFYQCIYVHCVSLQVTNVSVLMLVTVAVDRFFAIKAPYYYHRVMTPSKALCTNIIVWILGCSLGFVPMLWNMGYRRIESCSFSAVMSYEFIIYFQFLGLMLTPLVIMTCIYIYIVIIVRKHVKLENQIRQQLRMQDRNRDLYKDTSGVEKMFKKDVQAAKTFGMILFVYTVCWLPISILDIVHFLCTSDCETEYHVLLVAIVMCHVNSSINPFLYALTNVQVKIALRKLLGMATRNLEDSSPPVRPSRWTLSKSVSASAQPRSHSPTISNQGSSPTLSTAASSQ